MHIGYVHIYVIQNSGWDCNWHLFCCEHIPISFLQARSFPTVKIPLVQSLFPLSLYYHFAVGKVRSNMLRSSADKEPNALNLELVNVETNYLKLN